MHHHATDLSSLLKRLLYGPASPQNSYVDGVTYQMVYDLAQGMMKRFEIITPAPREILLCAEDKAVVMAALLAAMATNKILVLPHALTSEALAELARVTGCRHAIVDRPRPLPQGVATLTASDDIMLPFEIPKPAALDPDAVWVRLFTGGSTAAPKIWDKTVRNLLEEVRYLCSTYRVGPSDRILATVPVYHIYGLLYAILLPFVAAARVDNRHLYFPNEIVQAIQQWCPTLLISVPPHYRAFAGSVIEGGSLRLAFSSAGMLAVEDGRRFTQTSGVAVIEIYGSTETGGIAARNRSKGEAAFAPFECLAVKIEEERLWVRSDFISPGLCDPLTGFFKMGDRVSISPHGRFMLLGRQDGIVKVGGRRVDLEEIRQCLLAQKGVTDVAVLCLPVSNGRENHITAVVETSRLGESVLAQACRHLEPHARPRFIKIVEKMPFTAAGKYDRQALKALTENEMS